MRLPQLVALSGLKSSLTPDLLDEGAAWCLGRCLFCPKACRAAQVEQNGQEGGAKNSTRQPPFSHTAGAADNATAVRGEVYRPHKLRPARSNSLPRVPEPDLARPCADTRSSTDSVKQHQGPLIELGFDRNETAVHALVAYVRCLAGSRQHSRVLQQAAAYKYTVCIVVSRPLDLSGPTAAAVHERVCQVHPF